MSASISRTAGVGKIGELSRARQRHAEFADDPRRAGREHIDAVGEEHSLADIVGDQQRRPAVIGPHGLQPFLHLRARQRIECAKGLVEQQHVLLLHDGAQQGDALAHAPGKLSRIMVFETRKAEGLEQWFDDGPRRLPVHALDAKTECGIVDDAAPGHQRVALRHEGEGWRHFPKAACDRRRCRRHPPFSAGQESAG